MYAVLVGGDVVCSMLAIVYECVWSGNVSCDNDEILPYPAPDTICIKSLMLL